MRILVSDVAATQGGGLTLLEGFHRYLCTSGDDNDWFFLTGDHLFEDYPHVHSIALPGVKRSWLNRLGFDLLGGRRLVSRLQPDVVLSLQNTLIWGVTCPQVLYIHQALPFQNVRNYSLLRGDSRFLAVYQHLIGTLIKLSARSADRVIVQSDWMRTAVLEQVGLRDDSVVVIRPEVEDVSSYVGCTPFDPRDFFYPTGDFSYKNNACVEEASRILMSEGYQDFKITLTVPVSAGSNIAAVGRLPRTEVLQRLAGSTLVFPSLVETVGLPLLEASRLGSIVLAADLPYAREVLEGYVNAYYFDPDKPEELAGLMERVIEGKIQRIPSASVLPEVAQCWSKVVDLLMDVTGA